MDWIRENKTLATIAGIFLAGAVAIGAVLVLSHLSYGESLDQLGQLNTKVANQEKAQLYPKAENVAALEEKVSAYEDEVSNLGNVLLKLQLPVKDITDTDFQAKLKQSIADLRAKADSAKLKLPKDFAYGFEVYTVSLPRSAEAAKELNGYFDAVSSVVGAALDSGVSSIDALQRSDLSVEKAEKPATPAPEPKKKSAAKPSAAQGKKSGGKPAKAPKEITKVVERRQLNLTITTDQKPLQALMNALASPSKMPYFTVVRNIRVENEKQEGPSRNAPIDLGKETDVTKPEPEHKTENAENAAPKVEVITAPKAAKPDAVAVIGGEKLKVYLEIDLISFVTPAAETADAGSVK